MKPKYTPMMMQYLAIKEKHPDTLILFRLGDFYELFFDDAKTASRELQLALTGRNAGVDEKVPMCGVPHHAIQSYISKLISRGYKVGIVEQMEDPALAKGLVERDVIQIITPGARMDLADQENNYIVACDETEFNYTIAYADLTTGEVYVSNIEHDLFALISELDNLFAKEIVVSSKFPSATLDAILERRKLLISYENDDNIRLEDEALLQDVRDLYQMKTVMRLINYLRQTQKRDLNYLQTVRVLKASRSLQIDAYSRLNLELTRTIRSEEKYGSLLYLLDETKTAMGARLLKQWINKPSADRLEIEGRQAMITSLMDHFMVRADLSVQLDEVYDLERLIARIGFGNAHGRDLLQLKNSLTAIPHIKTLLLKLDNSSFTQLADKINPLTAIKDEIERAIRDDAPITIREGGIFKDGYSAELDELITLSHGGKAWVASLEAREREKTGIRTLKVGYNRVFGYYIEVSKGSKHLIQDDWGYERKQTTTNGERYITQELKEQESLILQADEKRMKLEYDLFVELRQRVQQQTREIQQLANQIALIDVLTSLAMVSSRPGYVCPSFNQDRVVDIKKGRHPVIEKVMRNPFVANDVYLPTDQEVLLITGPNMGGKSTYMRELALIVIMAQMGCYVPAESANLMVFDQIFTRIGASDDLVSGQSTFMVEMSEANYALTHASENSLLIFDEIGRGTSTYDGMALAQAMIEYITAHLHAKTLFSTHYHELTILETVIPALRNVQVTVKEEQGQITFLYQVKDGAMNKSYGINVARLAHLPEVLLTRATEILHDLEKRKQNISTKVLTPREQPEEPWISELKTLDPLAMTPLEALQFLYDLKKKMK